MAVSSTRCTVSQQLHAQWQCARLVVVRQTPSLRLLLLLCVCLICRALEDRSSVSCSGCVQVSFGHAQFM
jgi:hypothetical protein